MVRSGLARAIIFVLLLGLAAGGIAREKVLGMSKKVYDAISDIQLLIDEDKWAEGLEKLKLLRAAQRRINRLTSAFDQQQGEQPLDELRRRELRIIALRQAEVRRLTESLLQRE